MPAKHLVCVASGEGGASAHAKKRTTHTVTVAAATDADAHAAGSTTAETEKGAAAAASSDADTARPNDITTRSPSEKKRGRPRGSKSKKTSSVKKICVGGSYIDLTGVPPQPLILKNNLSRTVYRDNSRRRPVAEGSSRYTGIYLDKSAGKWKAQIMVDGSVRSIGYYEREEDAAEDYARAAFKYKPTKGGCETYGGLDLGGVPEQPLIRSRTSASGYKGVKAMKGRWQARITTTKGTAPTTLGTFDNVEEAAEIYARAAYYLDQLREEHTVRITGGGVGDISTWMAI